MVFALVMLSLALDHEAIFAFMLLSMIMEPGSSAAELTLREVLILSLALAAFCVAKFMAFAATNAEVFEFICISDSMGCLVI
jgi:hypothetical protein